MIAYAIIAAAFITMGLWNLMIAFLGCFPQFHETAVGSLSRAHTYRNVRTMSGMRLPNVTEYTYIYTVNGREYKYTSDGYHAKRRLMPKMTLVYVKWFPRHAYPNEFKPAKEWVFGILLLIGGLSLIWL